MPKITIITAAYNALRYISATVASVQNQTLQDWQLIIVNDGSTDETGALADQSAQTDGRIRVIHQTNHGLSYSRNQGIAALSPDSEFVAFIDADDVYHGRALQLLVEELERSPAAPAAYGAARFIDSAGDPYLTNQAEGLSRKRHGVHKRRLKSARIGAPTTFDMLVYRNFVWTPGQMVIRRDALDKVGVFDVDLSSVADWDLWIRLSASNELIYIDEVMLDYRRHDSNMSSDNDKMRQVELSMRRKHLGMFSPAQRQTALKGYQLSERGFARQRVRFARQCFREKQALTGAKHLTHALILTARSHINSVL